MELAATAGSQGGRAGPGLLAPNEGEPEAYLVLASAAWRQRRGWDVVKTSGGEGADVEASGREAGA